METTYYLGAGASAKAIPCVADLYNQIRDLDEFIQSNFNQDHHFHTAAEVKGVQRKVDHEDIRYLKKNVQNKILDTIEPIQYSLSIDTWAKVLFIKDRLDDYLSLKAVILASFIFWEKTRGVDNRYQNFWATLANIDISKNHRLEGFANKINIVSWNYDTQLETSIADILAETQLQVCRNDDKFGFVNLEETTGITYLKLNGQASLATQRTYLSKNRPSPFEKISGPSLASLLTSIIMFPDRFEEEIDQIKFCWEARDDTAKANLIQMASKVGNTRTLVVIGYSFPSINHSIDKQILSGMNLKTIYFQGKDRYDSRRIMDAFNAVYESYSNEVKLIPIESGGFFIPPDVTLPRNEGVPAC